MKVALSFAMLMWTSLGLAQGAQDPPAFQPFPDGSALVSEFADVESPYQRVAPDQTRDTQEPCPWTADDLCDAFLQLCFYDADPACN